MNSQADNSSSLSIAEVCEEFRAYWLAHDGQTEFEMWLVKVDDALKPQLMYELMMLDGRLRSEHNLTVASDLFPAFYNPGDTLEITHPVSTNNPLTGDEPTQCFGEIRDNLFSCSTLKALSPPASTALASRFQAKSFERGEAILRQGEPASGLYLIVSGTAEICIRRGDEKTTIDYSNEGHLLGEMSLLTGNPCSADVIATKPVSVLALSAEDYRQLCELHPELEIVISQLVSDRLGTRETDALSGKVIGGFELLRCISRGGMGVVYEANQVDSGERVALKMLRHRFIHEAEAINGFLQEGELLKALNHPNILSVKSCFVALNTRFLVMQLCEGEDLSRVVQHHGPLNEETVRAILGQMAAGLVYAHRQQVIHLDIKPANVLLSKLGQVLLSDFGLSRLLNKEDDSGIIRGTPIYMPPEQLDGSTLGPATDWYALACTAVSLLTGGSLFDARNLQKMIRFKSIAIPDEDWPKLNVSSELRKVLVGALHPNPLERKLDLKALATWASPVNNLV